MARDRSGRPRMTRFARQIIKNSLKAGPDNRTFTIESMADLLCSKGLDGMTFHEIRELGRLGAPSDDAHYDQLLTDYLQRFGKADISELSDKEMSELLVLIDKDIAEADDEPRILDEAKIAQITSSDYLRNIAWEGFFDETAKLEGVTSVKEFLLHPDRAEGLAFVEAQFRQKLPIPLLDAWEAARKH